MCKLSSAVNLIRNKQFRQKLWVLVVMFFFTITCGCANNKNLIKHAVRSTSLQTLGSDFSDSVYSPQCLYYYKKIIKSWLPCVKSLNGDMIYPVQNYCAQYNSNHITFERAYDVNRENKVRDISLLPFSAGFDYVKGYEAMAKNMITGAQGSSFIQELKVNPFNGNYIAPDVIKPVFDILFYDKIKSAQKNNEPFILVDFAAAACPRFPTYISLADIVILIDCDPASTGKKGFLPFMVSSLDALYPKKEIGNRTVIIRNKTSSNSALPRAIADVILVTNMHTYVTAMPINSNNTAFIQGRNSIFGMTAGLVGALKKGGLLLVTDKNNHSGTNISLTDFKDYMRTLPVLLQQEYLAKHNEGHCLLYRRIK